MSNWFQRPVWAVSDMNRALDFYLRDLGFTENWRHEEPGVRIVEVERAGCQIILSNQWPERVGQGLGFVSLEDGALDLLRAELAGRGITGEEGRWGYRLFILRDPDGNQLWFPYPAEQA